MMKYVQVEWQPADEDGRKGLYLEISDGIIRRQVEIYDSGVYVATKPHVPAPEDLHDLTEGGGAFHMLTDARFDEVWDQSQEQGEGMMQFFF